MQCFKKIHLSDPAKLMVPSTKALYTSFPWLIISFNKQNVVEVSVCNSWVYVIRGTEISSLFSLSITHSERSQLPRWRLASSLRRFPHGKDLRQPANSHLCELTWKSSSGQAWRCLQLQHHLDYKLMSHRARNMQLSHSWNNNSQIQWNNKCVLC